MLGRVDGEGKLMGWPTGIKRLVLAAAGVPLVATMTAVMLAAPASAAPQPAQAALVRQASPGHVYITLIKGLHVRKAPAPAAPVVAVLGPAGTKVRVACFAVGKPVFGDKIWYLIVAPHTGFVAGFYLGTGRDPAVGIPACGSLHIYRTLIKGLHVRKAPTAAAPAVAVLGAVGTKVRVNCYAVGKAVFGDKIWYLIVAPHTGFVAGFYLSTGPDPARGIRRC
jgi:hypothetical protein